MKAYRYQALGPLLAGEGSRAFLGLAISEDNRAVPVVIIWVPEVAEKDPAILAKVRHETEHAAKLDHPNIVTVLGFAELDEGHARVVEFADGEPLRKVLEAGARLPPSIAARIICDACTGTHYAHVAGNDDGTPLVHGDLRPETLLVGYSGSTKVTGYGALAFAPQEVGGQRLRGRQVHSAPEQIISGRSSMSLSTDVYLLGLCLYECLTGGVPWADQGDFFEQAVLTLPLPPPAPGTVPPALGAILEKACAKKAADRYPTPLAFREALEAALPEQVASTEEVARYVEGVFPESRQVRADRRHTIDAGIADFVRRQWAEAPIVSGSKQVEAPPPPPPPAPAPVIPGRPAVAVVHLRPPPVPDDDDDPRREQGRSAPWVLALAVFVGIIATWWAWKKANEPIRGLEPRAQLVEPAPTPRAKEVPSPALDAAVAVEPNLGARVADGGSAARSALAPVVDAGVEASPAEVMVTLESAPSVEIQLDGKPLGRTPWSGRLPPGRKTFILQNKDVGLSAARWVTVKPEPTAERFTFEKGTVSINAPEGALVVIDGRRIGVAPIRGEVPVFEGQHRITVTLGQTKFTQVFGVRPQERLTFNVTPQ